MTVSPTATARRLAAISDGLAQLEMTERLGHRPVEVTFRRAIHRLRAVCAARPMYRPSKCTRFPRNVYSSVPASQSADAPSPCRVMQRPLSAPLSASS